MRSPTILIVDDSDVVRAVLTSRLEEGGASVICASTMKDALAIDAASIHAAIVDVELGSDDGVSLAAVLTGRNPRLRIAHFTSDASERTSTTFHKPDDLDHVVAWALAKNES